MNSHRCRESNKDGLGVSEAPKPKSGTGGGEDEDDENDLDYAPPKRPRAEPGSPTTVYHSDGSEVVENTEKGALLVSNYDGMQSANWYTTCLTSI